MSVISLSAPLRKVTSGHAITESCLDCHSIQIDLKKRPVCFIQISHFQKIEFE